MSTRRDVLLALPLLAAGWVGLQSMLGGSMGVATASVRAPVQMAASIPVVAEARLQGLDARARTAPTTAGGDTAPPDAR
ncbi:MAG: hypothetical protein MUC74_04110 [Ideonella sp.]|jgi:hypothetical protein|nr:hypothetical protein [Ideonella sp.]